LNEELLPQLEQIKTVTPPVTQPVRAWREKAREAARRHNTEETKRLKRQLYSLETITRHQRQKIAHLSQGVRALRMELRQRWGCNNRRLREIQRDAAKTSVMTKRKLRNKINKFISPTNLEYSNYSNWRVYKCFEKWKAARQHRLTNGRDRIRPHSDFRTEQIKHLRRRLHTLAVPEYNLTGEEEDNYIKDIRRELTKWEGYDGSIYYKQVPRRAWQVPGDQQDRDDYTNTEYQLWETRDVHVGGQLLDFICSPIETLPNIPPTRLEQ